jgi:hypothetical protein
MTTTTSNPARFTDLTVVGTAADIRALDAIVRRSGALVHRTTPKAASRTDPRWRVSYRLHLHHR